MEGYLVAGLVLVGPMLHGLPLSEHFQTRGGRGMPAPDAPVVEQITYWTEIDPWYLASASTAARASLREVLTAHPQHLTPPIELERIPERPALARLGEVGVPTLIVVGESDIADVHAACGALEAGISGARRVVLPGSGHLPHVEVPDAFTQVLRSMIKASFK